VIRATQAGFAPKIHSIIGFKGANGIGREWWVSGECSKGENGAAIDG